MLIERITICGQNRRAEFLNVAYRTTRIYKQLNGGSICAYRTDFQYTDASKCRLFKPIITKGAGRLIATETSLTFVHREGHFSSNYM
jgi:hypothetical protein